MKNAPPKTQMNEALLDQAQAQPVRISSHLVAHWFLLASPHFRDQHNPPLILLLPCISYVQWAAPIFTLYFSLQLEYSNRVQVLDL